MSILSEKDMNVIRYHTTTGRPLGDERFAEKMERKMGRKFSRKLPGMARKQKIEYLGRVPEFSVI